MKPENLLTFDFETDPFLKGRFPRPFLGAVFNGEASSIFWGEEKKVVEKTIEFICQYCHGTKTKVYAHNGGKFDFYYLLPFLIKKFGHENLHLKVIGSRIAQIKTPLFTLRDSYALIPMKLAALGGKKEIEIEKLESDVRELHKQEIIEYCVQDCVALHSALMKYADEYGLSALTAAGSAGRQLQTTFDTKIPKSNHIFDSRFREFYFGGRVEFFDLGKLSGEFKIVDINSAYPHAMLSAHWYSRGFKISKEIPKDRPEISFYEVKCFSKGAFPFRGEDGGTCFPHENQIYKVTGWELMEAIKLNFVSNLRILKCYTPILTQSFERYTEHFYKLKKQADAENNQEQRNWAKLMMNSLYGKFALNPRKFKDVILSPTGFDEMMGYEKSFEDEEFLGVTFWQRDSEKDETKMRFANVACAASITGYVRANLLRSMNACEGVVYCDTDSIICRKLGPKLKIGTELGEWKLEAEVEELHIAGKKLYAAKIKNAKPGKEWKTASKGAKLSHNQLIELSQGESVTYEFQAPNLSPFSKPHYVKRKIVRADKIKKRGTEKIFLKNENKSAAFKSSEQSDITN